MKKITLNIIAMITITIGLSANVPYTFQPSTPAKASEVNANFQDLEAKLITLENKISKSIKCDKSPYVYTYSYTPSSIGDTITVGGKEYIIVAMPFIEHGTGDHYYIKYPEEKQGHDSSKTMSVSTSIYTEHVKSGNICYTHTFAGYPANDYTDIGYYNDYDAIMEDPSDKGSRYRVGRGANNQVSIKINQTLLYFTSNFRERIQDSQLISGDVDMTDNLDWSKMDANLSLVNNVKILLNYVEIVKMP